MVRFLAAEAGIDQFFDIGSGLPTQGNVSEVAHEINPKAHVVYVDNDPMVSAEAPELRLGTGSAGLVSLADWRPDEQTRTERDEIYHSFFGGVARKNNARKN